jgi:hypothetical protein
MLVRRYRPSDLSLVFDTSLNSWRTSRWAGVIPNHLYYETQRETIEGLLSRGAEIWVVYPESNEDFIIAWACAEEKEGACVLHYLYVKDPYREFHPETLLLNTLPGTKPGFVTHRLPFKEMRAWIHAPEIARRKSL